MFFKASEFVCVCVCKRIRSSIKFQLSCVTVLTPSLLRVFTKWPNEVSMTEIRLKEAVASDSLRLICG